jgi:hypothetical protein
VGVRSEQIRIFVVYIVTCIISMTLSISQSFFSLRNDDRLFLLMC